MNNAEAFYVLHEISDASKEAVTRSCVSLDPTYFVALKKAEGYQTKMKGG